MSSDASANGRSIVHKGDGLANIAALPDVCKTPTPAGPTPIPYVNVARHADLAGGSKSVKIRGNSVAHEGSRLSRSSGDEPGTLGGLISSTSRGKMTWGTASPDVIVEGRGVARFLDVTHHNSNTHNTIHVDAGEPIVVINYGDDAPCKLCGATAPADGHVVLPDNSAAVQAKAEALLDQLAAMGESLAMMVAVAACDCGRHLFAAHSGQATVFMAASAAVGGLKTVGADRLTPTDLVKKRLLERHKNRFPGQSQKEQSDYLNSFKRALRRGWRGTGICAGPRALALALAAGHRPKFLCERLYKPHDDYETEQQNIYRTFGLTSSEFAAWPTPGVPATSTVTDTRTFAHRSRVPSCSACAEQVPAMLCQLVPPCPQ